MIAVDTSVLALAINRYSPDHGRAALVLEELVNGSTPWALPWPAVEEFLATVTHPHAVARVLAPRDAWAFVEELATSPSLSWLGAGERHAAAVSEVLELAAIDGPLPPGFALAVVLREHGVRRLLTVDRAMRRYGFLERIDPLRADPAALDRTPRRRYRRLSPARG